MPFAFCFSPGVRFNPTAPTETEEALTLEELPGEDYMKFLTDTITMQMENRMEKNPDVEYYPIVDNAPLNNFAEIGENNQFELDEAGYLTIRFPAGTVTAPEHGEQRFRVIKTSRTMD
ncbi:MAG: DUF3298 domain-containing protein [Faecousia sp.]